MKKLIFDIETAPILGYTWRAWKTNIIEVEKDWQMICFAYKWYDQKKVHFVRGEINDPYDDDAMVNLLWKLFDEADLIIGHNLDRFDVKKSNALFARKGLTKPSPFKTIDTLKVARKNFHNTSNRLGSLGEQYGIGSKVETAGFMKLFKGCMKENDPKVWRDMKRYNLEDVRLTERLYDYLRSWMPQSHPVNLNEHDGCPICSSSNLQRRGFSNTKTYRYQRFQCRDCGSWTQSQAKEPLHKPRFKVIS